MPPATTRTTSSPAPWSYPPAWASWTPCPNRPGLPARLAEQDIQAYAEDFALHGERAFTGAFSWYRNIQRNNELLAPFRGRGIDVPALYVVGDRGMVTSLRGPDRPGSPLSDAVPRLRGPVVLPGCGHWTQQERPAEVNTARLDFLARIDDSATR